MTVGRAHAFELKQHVWRPYKHASRHDTTLPSQHAPNQDGFVLSGVPQYDHKRCQWERLLFIESFFQRGRKLSNTCQQPQLGPSTQRRSLALLQSITGLRRTKEHSHSPHALTQPHAPDRSTMRRSPVSDGIQKLWRSRAPISGHLLAVEVNPARRFGILRPGGCGGIGAGGWRTGSTASTDVKQLEGTVTGLMERHEIQATRP